jgi:hypothetical protein
MEEVMQQNTYQENHQSAEKNSEKKQHENVDEKLKPNDPEWLLDIFYVAILSCN